MYVRLECRPRDIQQKMKELMNMLPYPQSWFERQTDAQITAMYLQRVRNVKKMVVKRKSKYTADDVHYTIWKDEQEVRRRAGLPTTEYVPRT